MSSILAAIFKSTIGLLVNKARDKTAEHLKDGDVADEAFRNLIVREIEDVKTKLNGLARKDLLTSIELFKAGILNLNQVFEKSSACTNEPSEGAAAAVRNTSELATSHVTNQLQNLQLTDLNESAKKSLADAEKRFASARLEATRAFSNEALSTSDRILALKIQLMATILERVDRPADALDECRLCLENLHAMPAVRQNFTVQLTGGLRSIFNKKEREAAFVSVYQVNAVVLRVTQIAEGGRAAGAKSLPRLQVGDELVDVLSDERVVEQLRKLDMPELCVGCWSFIVLNKDSFPSHSQVIATNTRDQMFIAIQGKISLGHLWLFTEISLYSPSGKYVHSVGPHLPYGSVRAL